ncbi:MAG TPA: pseudouridine synthase, partial [Hyphomonas sp.]|nr:pseudouridine synthase [Hyphomonas sp.]
MTERRETGRPRRKPSSPSKQRPAPKSKRPAEEKDWSEGERIAKYLARA